MYNAYILSYLNYPVSMWSPWYTNTLEAAQKRFIRYLQCKYLLDPCMDYEPLCKILNITFIKISMYFETIVVGVSCLSFY